LYAWAPLNFLPRYAREESGGSATNVPCLSNELPRRNRGTKEFLRKVAQALGESPHKRAGAVRAVAFFWPKCEAAHGPSAGMTVADKGSAVPSPAAESGKITVDDSGLIEEQHVEICLA
jgi:hypothetical protein